MDRIYAGKTNLLISNGSVYDLVAIFIVLIGCDKPFANNLVNIFNNYLDNGYTYSEIRNEIFSVFYKSNKDFRWYLFNNKKINNDNINLLKSNTPYFHNQLKLLNSLPIVEQNINKGTMVSRVSEYYLEPVASYTIQDFIQYFYKVMPVDKQSQVPSKLKGIFKYKIEQYGIDKLLFMTDIYAQDCEAEGSLFILGKWDDYSYKADSHIEAFKSNLPQNEAYYTPKKRRLFE